MLSRDCPIRQTDVVLQFGTQKITLTAFWLAHLEVLEELKEAIENGEIEVSISDSVDTTDLEYINQMKDF